MDKVVLFNYLRRSPFGGSLTQGQVKGVERLLEAWEDLYPESDIRWVAYHLATVFHETGQRMQPVRETFASSDRQAKARLDAAWRDGKLPWVSKPYWREGWFGRGDIQITHKTNYRRMQTKLGIDLLNKPHLALDPTVSAQISIMGMVEGMFTGKKLSDYFSDSKDDPVNARKIVNGLDKASLIASYYKSFYDSLVKAQSSTAEELPDVTSGAAKPDDKVPTPKESPGLWTMFVTFVTGLVGSIVKIDSPEAAMVVGLLIVASAGFAFLYFTGRIKFDRGD